MALAALVVDEPEQGESTEQPSTLSGFGVGELVIIRTYSAGVFFGRLKAREGKEALLEDSRRLWSWEGAFTLSAVAREGVTSARLSISEPEKLITEVIEVIPVSNEVGNKLTKMEAHNA